MGALGSETPNAQVEVGALGNDIPKAHWEVSALSEGVWGCLGYGHQQERKKRLQLGSDTKGVQLW